MDSFTAKEISRKYNHTTAMIRIKETKKEYPVYFEGFSHLDDGQWYCQVSVLNPDLSKKQETLFLKDFFILPMPDRKVFDSLGRTFVYTRVPNRQWRKGVCSDNASILDVVGGLVYSVPVSNKYEVQLTESRLFDLRVLHSLFTTRGTQNFDLAVHEILSKKLLSCAIDDQYWLSVSPFKQDEFILYRFEVPVAFFNNKSKSFTLVNKIYHQEVSDFCNRRHLNYNLEV